jgi:hypothetical protein
VTVLAHRLQNPSFQQRRHQFVDRGFRAADAAGDFVRAQGWPISLRKSRMSNARSRPRARRLMVSSVMSVPIKVPVPRAAAAIV